MGLFDLFRRPSAAQSPPETTGSRVSAQQAEFFSLDDPRLVEFLRMGAESASGAVVTPRSALHNMAVFRCVDLISSSIGMLPLYLMQKGSGAGDISQAVDHPLYDLLLSEPNGWQTAFEFKAMMQAHALMHGNAYALIVRSLGRVIQLVPLDPTMVQIRQNPDWSLSYTYTRPDGSTVTPSAGDILHIRGLSLDGILGMSRTRLAREAIGLALQTERASGRLFKNGVMVGGALAHPKKLSEEAFERLKASIEERYTGADNAGKWLILEEGLEAKPIAQTAKDSQNVETRAFQIEEVARAFGVPRPLLMIDDTSWGSGIEQLGILFVRFGLAPWFQAWEQGIARTCLSKVEKRTYYADFDERELLRGSMADQADFYAKALGAGGQRPWMTQNEVRSDTGLPQHPQGDDLTNPMTQKPPASNDNGNSNNAA